MPVQCLCHSSVLSDKFNRLNIQLSGIYYLLLPACTTRVRDSTLKTICFNILHP